MQVFYADQFVLPLPPGTGFRWASTSCCATRSPRMPQVQLMQALRASDGELALAHTPAYIDAIATGTASAQRCARSAFRGARRWPSGRAGRWAPPSRRLRVPRSGGRGGQPGRRHPPCLCAQGGRLLRVQRRAVAARLMQAEQARVAAQARPPAGGRDRPGRAPGQWHGQHLSPTIPACSRCRCMGRRTFRSARRRATWTWTCPTAAATRVPARAGSGAGRAGQPVSPRCCVLPGRCRPARGRPPGAPEAELGRPGGARPPRVRLGLAAPRAAGVCHGRWLWHDIGRHRAGAGQHLSAWPWSTGGAGRIPR
jgi:hypothetical protein